MNNIDIHIVEWESETQRKSIELRYKVLREPLGLVYTPDQMEAEREETHIVAQQNGKVTGVVVLKKISDILIKMRQVAVDPSLQRSGIGKKMVVYSEKHAREHGFKKMELHARLSAVDFYLSMDYKIEGDEFTEVGIPHYKMYKDL